MNKAELGKSFWTVLHTTVQNVKDPPTGREQREIISFINSMAEIYPCDECKGGFDWILDREIDFSSKKSLVLSICNWHNAVNSHIGHPVFDCAPEKLEELYSMPCPSCTRRSFVLTNIPSSTTRFDTTSDIVEAERNHYPLSDDRGRRAAEGLMARLCKKYNVPMPKIRFEENMQLCPGTSCSVMDAKHPIETTQIYWNPSQFSARTGGHEFYHYLASIKKPEEIRALLGPSFLGDPDDEREADAFAFREMDEIFAMPSIVKVNKDTGISGSGMTSQQLATVEELKVMKQELLGFARGGSVFARLADLYSWATPYANVNAEELNLIWTPNIFGTVLGIAYDLTLTPLGAIITDLITAIVLGAIGMQGSIAHEDRLFLQEWASYHGTRLLNLGNPVYLGAAVASAKSLGAAISAKDGKAVAAAVVNPTPIGTFRQAFKAIQEGFAEFKLPNISLPKIPGTAEEGNYPGTTQGTFQ